VHVEPTDESARTADSYGTGELILAALDAVPDKVILGLGGSATTDGGAGALRALGARFLDANGEEIAPGGIALRELATVDLSGLDPRLQRIPLVVCCDVVSPLTGPLGAAHVFGPQKGASPQSIADLDRGLSRLSEALARSTGRDASSLSWGGAAGGTSGGLFAALGATFQSGIEEIAELLDLDGHLAWADVVIIGEGSLDQQSLAGKAPIGVADHARRSGVPVLAVAGQVRLDPHTLALYGIRSSAALTDLVDIEGSTTEAAKWTAVAAERVMTDWMKSVGSALSAEAGT
jgi:glycerate kinase